ncbi:MAG: hypothetical protein NTW07_10730, partial [candidate division Zixibacteria bacterium]|nr:hypothetical protein [candidate division Zixibacteria bacterium]
MKLSFHKSSAVLLLLIVFATTTAYAWDKEEHRLLADSVFSSVMRDCATEMTAERLTSESPAFGNKAAQLVANDFDRARFHKRGQTVMDQLTELSVESLNAPGGATSPAPSVDNVVAAFFLSHIRAMRIASEAGSSNLDDSSALVMALHEEALAQGYLADAFAAGHILSYNDLPLSFLQRRNRIEAHNYHRDRGVYVINGRGDVWQTFGDGLLHWYPPTYRAVFDACAISLKEVLVVWYVSHGVELPESLAVWLKDVAKEKTPGEVVHWWLSGHTGPEYYRVIRLPSLMCLPMPITATWSYRTDEIDEHGARQRHHYPQLRENGYHDPDLADIDDALLYSSESVPEWMIPEPLRAASSVTAHELIKSDPNWASVRYVQNRHAPPSYRGLLLQA